MDANQAQPGEASKRHQMPTWVRAFLVVAVVGLAILATVMITGGGDHGPGRHQPHAPAEPTTHVPPVDHG